MAADVNRGEAVNCPVAVKKEVGHNWQRPKSFRQRDCVVAAEFVPQLSD
jgi:hypothetical protein